METKCRPILAKLSHSDIPSSRAGMSANTKFAIEAVKMFLELRCDAVEVSGWPVRRDASNYAASLNTAIDKLNVRAKCKALTRTIDGDQHVYLERR